MPRGGKQSIDVVHNDVYIIYNIYFVQVRDKKCHLSLEVSTNVGYAKVIKSRLKNFITISDLAKVTKSI